MKPSSGALDSKGQICKLRTRTNSPCEGERVPLEVRDFGAGQENVLAGLSDGLLLLDLDFHNTRGMLDDLVDMGAVTGANFTEDALEDPDHTTDEPVPLQ